MLRTRYLAPALACAALGLAACGSNQVPATQPVNASEPLVVPTPKPYRPVIASKPKPKLHHKLACTTPDGTEMGSLRFRVRMHDHELKDSPWVLVHKGGMNYMAAEIKGMGSTAIVLVSFPNSGQYLAGMKAVNGTARTFTDLPNGGDAIPKAGERALDCMGGI